MYNCNKLINVFSVIILVLMTTSFRWPVDNGQITSTFGEYRSDHYHDGVDMVSYNKKVYPISNGELLYTWNKKLFPFDEYFGSGNYIILSHTNIAKSRFYSVYYHLDDSDVIKDSYVESEPLGEFANTGRSYGAHIHFNVLNSRDMSSINSFKLLPEIEDKKSPKIGEFALYIENKHIILNNNSKIRLTRHYPMLVKIKDSIKGNERLGIYKLNIIFNNEKVLDIKFDKMLFIKNRLTFSGKTFQNLYDSKGYYKIENLQYQQGKNTWIVSTEDFAGNLTKKIFQLDINLDM